MTKSELIKSLSAKYTQIDRHEIKKLVNVILSKMTDSIVGGARVEIRGFGSFSIRTRNEKKARNPKTDEIITVDKKNAIYFRPGKAFFDKLNND